MLMIAITTVTSAVLLHFTQYVDRSEQTFYTRPNVDDFNFAAVGDWGCNNNTRNTVNNIISKDPERVLGLGDYSYDLTADCWFDIIDPIKEKTRIVIGNHEHTIYEGSHGVNGSYYSPSLLNQYMSEFGLTKQFYSFNYHNVHFLALSTELPLGIGPEQYEFVENDLIASSSNSSIDWTIAYFHYPMYPASDRIADPKMFRELYHPLFDKYGVDLVLQGHDHNYQRSFPLQFDSSNPSFPNMTSIAKSDYVNPDGEIFVIIGTGGESLYEFLPSPLYVVQTQAFGFLNVDFVNKGLTMRASFHANDGTTKDSFVIVKRSDV